VLTSQRRQTIVRWLQQHGGLHVAELSERLGVSPSTIRRDLQELSRQGLIKRSYGGASLPAAGQELSPPNSLGEVEARMGRAVAALLIPGETLFLAAGPMALAVAHALSGRDDLTVITASLPAACHLAGHSQVELIVVGGLVNRESAAMTGHLAEQALEGLHADRLILGVQGLTTPDGLTSDDLAQVRMAQLLLQTVPEVIVVAEPSCLGRVCTARIAPVDRADVILTGHEAPDAILWELAELEIKVILA